MNTDPPVTSGPVEPATHNPDWSSLADQAGRYVNSNFGHPLMGLPGTWIGKLAVPATVKARPWSEWHYWWQAHYLDALVDTGLRTHREDRRTESLAALGLAKKLLRGMMLRNFGRFPNYFYDDMAWLALAADRFNDLSLEVTGKPATLANFARRTLGRQLLRAHDSVLGGGIYWSRKRDYKNAPANGPAALHLARIGEQHTAQSILDWLRTELFDSEQGLYLDGIHPSMTGRDVEANIFTYNQGPVLAALLELDHLDHPGQAADLIADVALHLSTPEGGLRLEPGGDGSLFTGILCRYLALAARDSRLPSAARTTAADLVGDTAVALLGQPEPKILSAAVQRWTIFEAAAAVSA